MKSNERAIYLDLLAYQWFEGGLPADEEMLAKMAAVSLEEFRVAAPAVMRNFKLRRGQYQNLDLAKLRGKSVKKLKIATRRHLVSRSQRFAVFQRDNFTCQYCGRKAPEAVLELDHVRPVVAGGGPDESNLITSCWECNRGKAARLIESCEVQPGIVQ